MLPVPPHTVTCCSKALWECSDGEVAFSKRGGVVKEDDWTLGNSSDSNVMMMMMMMATGEGLAKHTGPGGHLALCS